MERSSLSNSLRTNVAGAGTGPEVIEEDAVGGAVDLSGATGVRSLNFIVLSGFF